MAVLEWVAAMEIVCKDSVKGDRESFVQLTADRMSFQ